MVVFAEGGNLKAIGGIGLPRTGIVVVEFADGGNLRAPPVVNTMASKAIPEDRLQEAFEVMDADAEGSISIKDVVRAPPPPHRLD